MKEKKARATTMGFAQNTRQRLGSAAHFVGKHATAGKAALTAAAVAGAAYSAYQTHGQVQAQRERYSGPPAHGGGGGGVGGFLGAIPGTAALELLREAREERRMGVRR